MTEEIEERLSNLENAMTDNYTDFKTLEDKLIEEIASINAGCDATHSKPFDRKEIEQAVRSIIDDVLDEKRRMG